jgi:hypothetical protein
LHLCVAVTLALTYFLFQVEPFEEEYREAHPVPVEGATFSAPSVNWESFDKTNAPKAFVVDPVVPVVMVAMVLRVDPLDNPLLISVDPVRDKSPPTPSL